MRQRPITANPDDREETTEAEATGTDGNQSKDASTSAPSFKNVVQTMKWGVLPRNKAPEAARTLNTINARIETILEGSYLWAPLAEAKRCVVVSDGYVMLTLLPAEGTLTQAYIVG